MRKNIIQLMAVLMLFCGTPTFAAVPKVPNPIEVNADSVKIVVLTERLEEINKIDKSLLSRKERKALRKEIKSIDKQLRQANGGIYVSVGAAIIIVLLLIILL